MVKYFIVVFLIVTSTIHAQEAKDIPEEVLTSVQKRIDYGLSPSIAIGIIDEAGPRYYMYGSTSVEGEEVDEHTIYEIGSISKVFTAILLADASLNGTLSIDDPVEMHLPEEVSVPARNGQKITLGHLSDHTSALTRLPDNMDPADSSNPYADYSVDQMYDFLSRHELRRDIGSEYEYSNLAQGLLGHTLALKASKSYEQLTMDVIADELGMSKTKITLNNEMKQNLAIGHHNREQVSNWDLPTLAGAGAIRSSVHDMLIFLGANLGLKKSGLYEAMALSHQQRHDKAGMGVGLGWHIRKGEEGDVIWHNGGTGGYRTFAGFVNETGKGVVVLTNSTDGSDDIGFRLLDSSAELKEIKESATLIFKKAFEEEGIDAAKSKYKKLRTMHRSRYNFSESDMNTLGYEYLQDDEIEKAMEVLKLNMEVNPSSSNVYDSYAESLKEASIKYYKKSLELNPGNTNAVEMLQEMGVDYETARVEVAEDVLSNYDGIYELAPNFNIEITHNETQLFAQATGQPKFELFPKNQTEFFLRVVEAQVTFQIGDDGKATGLILFQNGQVIPGKKLESD